MSTYTIIPKTIICPRLNIKITLNGKYYLSDDPNTPYEASFHYASCPIVQNSSLAFHDQEEKYKYLQCPNIDERCTQLNEFPEKIDLRKATHIK